MLCLTQRELTDHCLYIIQPEETKHGPVARKMVLVNDGASLHDPLNRYTIGHCWRRSRYTLPDRDRRNAQAIAWDLTELGDWHMQIEWPARPVCISQDGSLACASPAPRLTTGPEASRPGRRVILSMRKPRPLVPPYGTLYTHLYTPLYTWRAVSPRTALKFRGSHDKLLQIPVVEVSSALSPVQPGHPADRLTISRHRFVFARTGTVHAPGSDDGEVGDGDLTDVCRDVMPTLRKEHNDDDGAGQGMRSGLCSLPPGAVKGHVRSLA